MSEERRIKKFALSMAEYLNSFCENIYNCNADEKVNELISLEDIQVYSVGYIGNINAFFKECAEAWMAYVDSKIKTDRVNVFWVKPPKVTVDGDKYKFRTRLAVKAIISTRQG